MKVPSDIIDSSVLDVVAKGVRYNGGIVLKSGMPERDVMAALRRLRRRGVVAFEAMTQSWKVVDT